ncbi:hypothetical protein BSU01_14380 [Erwinia billingiae]|uniref:DUF6651 domain-containing protein n=1 Tax=Erwinia billingiae TaxID=182337 RepID=UPI0019D244AE|nr:DUF6651 domain-containing protein [Erwinia billingiae]MBN7122887.1 hypothetical protein [Erwinia billingiae]
MKLKLDENGHVVVSDGKPVYVHDDGKEVAFDAAGTVQTISRLNGEAKSHRERAESAETAVKAFEGIKDPKEAMKALETIKNLDAKKLVDAGEVEKVRAEAIKAVEDKYAPILQERDDLSNKLIAEKVGGSFARSKFISEKMGIPADMVEARFGNNFKLEGDSVIAYDKSGNKIFSASNPGEAAGFDEALGILVEHYPYKDQILKGTGASGGGSGGGNGGTGGKTISRAQFESLSPQDQSSQIGAGVTITD